MTSKMSVIRERNVYPNYNTTMSLSSSHLEFTQRTNLNISSSEVVLENYTVVIIVKKAKSQLDVHDSL